MCYRLVFRGNWDVLTQCYTKYWLSVKLFAIYVLGCCLAIGHFVVRVPQITRAFLQQSHHYSGNPLCTVAIAVPSFTLRTALSATPFVPERWRVMVSWSLCKSWQNLSNVLELSVYIISGFCDGRRNLCKHDIVSNVPCVFVGQLWMQFVKSFCTTRAC